jgi:hypothetical protein
VAIQRKFIVYIATIADGIIARPDGAPEWLDRPRPKGDYGMGLFYRSIDTCILGRKPTICRSALACPRPTPGKETTSSPETLKKAASPKVMIVNENVAGFTERLRARKGKDIWLVGVLNLSRPGLALRACGHRLL